jgi:hypothetical protein
MLILFRGLRHYSWLEYISCLVEIWVDSIEFKWSAYYMGVTDAKLRFLFCYGSIVMSIHNSSLVQDWDSLTHLFGSCVVVTWRNIVFFLFIIGSSSISIERRELLAGRLRDWKSLFLGDLQLFDFIHFIKISILPFWKTTVFWVLISPSISIFDKE